MPKSLHIVVCTHQAGYIYGSEILRPIIVGAANMGRTRFKACKKALRLKRGGGGSRFC